MKFIRSSHWPLFLIVVLFVGVALVYSINTPIGEGSDEPAHYSYVLSMARGDGLPLMRAAGPASVTYEAHQPPLYYLVSALAVCWIDTRDAGSLLQQNPNASYDPLALTDRNLFLHTRREWFPYQGAVLAIHIARAVSILFGVGAIMATYGLARTLFPSRPVIWSSAAAFVAFLPQFGFSSGVVTNDGASSFITAATLWQLARVVVRLRRPQPTPENLNSAAPSAMSRQFALLGVLLGLGPLVKESGLVLLPFSLLVLGVMTGLSQTSAVRRTLIRGTLIAFLLFLLLSGWWYLLRYAVLGFWFGSPESATPLFAEVLSLEGFLAQWTELEISFWGLFGWNIVPLPQPVYDGLRLLALIALAGAALALVRRGELSASERAALIALSLFVLLVFAVFARWMSTTYQAHGRLLFPALPAFAIVCCLGLSQWTPRRWRSIACAGFIVSGFALSLWSATVVLASAYPHPTIVSASTLDQSVQPLAANLGDRVALLGYRLSTSRSVQGDVMDVTVYWKATSAMDVDYTVTVQVFDEAGMRIGHLDTYPVYGMYLTHDWRVGEILQDHYPLVIDPSARRPLRATVMLGMYDSRTNKALQIILPDGRRVGRVTLEPVEIR